MRTTEPIGAARCRRQLVLGVLAATSALTDSKPTYGREQEELHRDEPLRALLGGVGEDALRR